MKFVAIISPYAWEELLWVSELINMWGGKLLALILKALDGMSLHPAPHRASHPLGRDCGKINLIHIIPCVPGNP